MSQIPEKILNMINNLCYSVVKIGNQRLKTNKINCCDYKEPSLSWFFYFIYFDLGQNLIISQDMLVHLNAVSEVRGFQSRKRIF